MNKISSWKNFTTINIVIFFQCNFCALFPNKNLYSYFVLHKNTSPDISAISFNRNNENFNKNLDIVELNKASHMLK